jgi:hypothetical protein
MSGRSYRLGWCRSRDQAGVRPHVTFTEAVVNAARWLMNAEPEPDLARMERTEALADSWMP